MTKEQLKPFLENVRVNTTLQEKLKATADSDAALTIAKKAGFMVSADDIQTEMSEEELDALAGGKDYCLLSAMVYDSHYA